MKTTENGSRHHRKNLYNTITWDGLVELFQTNNRKNTAS